MLVVLNIKNFALIQELSVEFGAGFNILSGETGAGKSILIDTIDYVKILLGMAKIKHM